MVEIVRGDASRIDELEPLWLALRESTDSWQRRRQMYACCRRRGITPSHHPWPQ